MNTYLVAVVDGAKARFLILEPLTMPEYESGPKLVELEGLFSAEKEQLGEDLWTTTKPGRNRGTLGQAHGYDDHRVQHMTEFSRRFTQSIADRLSELIQSRRVNSLILVAEPKILGLLRESMASVVPEAVQRQDLAKDLCALKPHELQDYLAQRGVLPAYRSALSA